ncbi:hypothetical protein [Desulfotalea psychrophila]|uniref:Cell division protein ZapB n=1 Tax=Desulfotalea psychrophila (strain LSv54 / DSM 12343) TaxID=177439 RepID=Q6AJ79_DESPS|nr:hypothetical protein [Desulfotalea psychrophila]CAG37601.1 unknown protein [Desulfotalea psychrophila LSv54]
MSEGNELQRLEIFVGKLLKDFETLRVKLVEKQAVIEELNDQLAMQQLEKEDISERVTRIVTQFESWERDLTGGGVSAESPVVQEDVVQESSYHNG